MRKMKKLASLLLALVMVLSLSVTAMASSDTGTDTPTTYTITITSEKSGHTYEAYQVFTGDLSDGVLSNVVWGTGVNSAALLTALKADTTVVSEDSTSGDDITVGSLFASCTTAADVAKVLSDNNTNSTLAKQFAQLASQNLMATEAETSTETTSPYTITGLSAGYYLVKDKDDSVTANGDAYTDIILEVVCDVTTASKAVYPTVTKTVSDEDASINDTVTYTLTGTVPDTSAYDTYTYIFHDTLSKGLTYTTNSLVVKVDGTPLVENTDYTLTVGEYSVTTGTTITVTMLNAKDLSGKTIVVTYDATLNSNAVIGGSGNDNRVKVEYSNDPNWVDDGTTPTTPPPTGETPEDVVVTWTFELDVTKVDGKDRTKTLKGAEFVLYKTVSGENYYVQVDENNKVTGWTTVEADASTLTSGADGNFSIIGLDAGTYSLKETEAPSGYNLLVDPITIVITATYKDTDGDENDDAIDTLTATANSKSLTTEVSDGTVSAEIENNAGSTLPSTGGIGTTIFYVIGTIMVLGAAVVLITRRRMSSAK